MLSWILDSKQNVPIRNWFAGVLKYVDLLTHYSKHETADGSDRLRFFSYSNCADMKFQRSVLKVRGRGQEFQSVDLSQPIVTSATFPGDVMLSTSPPLRVLLVQTSISQWAVYYTVRPRITMRACAWRPMSRENGLTNLPSADRCGIIDICLPNVRLLRLFYLRYCSFAPYNIVSSRF